MVWFSALGFWYMFRKEKPPGRLRNVIIELPFWSLVRIVRSCPRIHKITSNFWVCQLDSVMCLCFRGCGSMCRVSGLAHVLKLNIGFVYCMFQPEPNSLKLPIILSHVKAFAESVVSVIHWCSAHFSCARVKKLTIGFVYCILHPPTWLQFIEIAENHCAFENFVNNVSSAYFI
jgi:hypothetical protein